MEAGSMFNRGVMPSFKMQKDKQKIRQVILHLAKIPENLNFEHNKLPSLIS
jgi:hypothetical protein